MPIKSLTTGEIALLCGVNIRTVIRWIQRGHLKAYQLPGRGDNRVMLQDFLEFLKANQMPIPKELETALETTPEEIPPAALAKPVSTSFSISSATSDLPPTAPHRILVIEDEPEMAHSIERTLRRAGFQTAIADDGFKAGLLLERFRPDLVTLDLQMPGIGGQKVLSFIRGHPELSGVKVLVISGLLQDALQEARSNGADEVLEKGNYSAEMLVQKVRALLGL